MSQFYLSSVNDSQSMEDISRLVQEGILSLGHICTSLYKAHVDPVTDTCSNFQQIRHHIKYADQCMEKSEFMLKRKLICLDGCMAGLMEEQQQFQKEKRKKNLIVEELCKRKMSAKESLKVSNAAVRQAERNQEAAEHELEKMEDLRNTGKWVAVGGFVITAVPIFGWVAGPLIMTDGFVTIEKATKAIKHAKHELKESRSQVKKHTKNILDYSTKISETQNEIEMTNQMLCDVKSNIESLQQRLVALAEIQQNFRKAVFHMGVLSGTVNLMETLTQRSVSWEPMIKMIQDVGHAVITIANNKLLCSQNVPALIHTLTENIKELKALCTASHNSEYVCYY